MARAPYQVLVLPYRQTAEGTLYGVFRRADGDIWQFIAGGGETCDASPLAAARREALEEAGIPGSDRFTPLESQCSIPTSCFSERARAAWGRNCFVIPEYAFAVEVSLDAPVLSREHEGFCWLPYESAAALLRYDSNKTALWELREKLSCGAIGSANEEGGDRND